MSVKRKCVLRDCGPLAMPRCWLQSAVSWSSCSPLPAPHCSTPSDQQQPRHSTIKLVSLSALCILMTALTIVMHISRTHRDPKTPPYNPAAAVLLTEIGKLLCAICLSVREVKQLLLQEAEDEYGGGMSAHGAGDQHDDVFASRSRSRSRSKNIPEKRKIGPTSRTTSGTRPMPLSPPSPPSWRRFEVGPRGQSCRRTCRRL